MEETIAIIKDCIFENVMMGNEIIPTLQRLHIVDGFEKEDIMRAYNEMLSETTAEE